MRNEVRLLIYCDQGEDMINSEGLRAWKLMYRLLTMKALAVRQASVRSDPARLSCCRQFLISLARLQDRKTVLTGLDDNNNTML